MLFFFLQTINHTTFIPSITYGIWNDVIAYDMYPNVNFSVLKNLLSRESILYDGLHINADYEIQPWRKESIYLRLPKFIVIINLVAYPIHYYNEWCYNLWCPIFSNLYDGPPILETITNERKILNFDWKHNSIKTASAIPL